jgi:FG-GAP-like repeat
MRLRGATLATLALALAAPAGAAAHSNNGFVEPVRVLHSWHGAAGGFFGWAVSELADIDGDHADEVIIGEPATPNGGTTFVYSGRSGRLIYTLPGVANDFQGGAIADAGDTNGDGVHDIVSGAPGTGAAGGPGRVYLYSGRTGRRLHTWEGGPPNDQLGYAVASAGDQDHDGHADVLAGAVGVNGGAGAAYVFSGRTYKVLRRIDGGAGDGFGSAVDWTRSLDRDRRPDLIVGAFTEPGAHVFAGLGGELFSLAPPPAPGAFGQFFVAGVGRVNGDRTPDLYAADYAANGGAGYAAVYSGRDGSAVHQWCGGPGDGTGPGREAGDVDRDRRVDLTVGSYTASYGAPGAGRVEIHSGRTGGVLRTITSTTAGENLGFDAVGVGDVDRDHEPDLLLSAASGSTVYLIAGTDKR